MAERGRPSIFSEELATRICERLAFGETLRAICRDVEMPAVQTVLDWKANNDAFSGQYETARITGYQLMADELTEIADDKLGEPQRDRLRVDTRKWLLSKALPKIYGDKLAHVGGSEGDAPIRTITEIRTTIVDPKAPA
jgi:hypothetical protein